MFTHAQNKRLSLRLCGRYKSGSGKIIDTSGSKGTNTSVRSRKLAVHAAWMQAERDDCTGEQERNRISDLSKCYETVTWHGEIPRWHSCLVPRCGRQGAEMRGKVLRLGKQKQQAIRLSLHRMFGWSSIQKGWIGERWRIIKVSFHIVLKCLKIFCSHRQTWLLMVYETFDKSYHQWNTACGKGLARFIPCIHFTSGYRQYGTVGNTASKSKLSLFQVRDFACDLADSKSTSGGVLSALSRIQDQLWSDPRSWSNSYDSEFQNFAALRFWIASQYTEWFGRRFLNDQRTILKNLQQFKEFGIFLSGFETWYFRDSKERYEKGIIDYADSITSLPKEGWNFGSYWWNLFSRFYDGLFGVFLLRSRILENVQTFLELQSWKVNLKTEVCLRTAEPQVTVLWIKEGEVAKSIDELVTSRSITGQHNFLHFDMLDAMIASALKNLFITQSNFRKRSKCRGATRSTVRPILTRNTNCVHDLRVFPCNWSVCNTTGTRRCGQYDIAEWRCPRFRCEMGSCTIISEWNAFRPDPRRIVQVKITEIRSTLECDVLAWPRSCSNKLRHGIVDNWGLRWNFILIKWREIWISKPGTILWKGVQSPRVKKETRPMLRGKWECFQWKAHGQCSKGDSCCFSHDSLASGNRASSHRRKGRSTSPASHSKAKQTDGEKGDKEENSDKRSVILCRYNNCKKKSVV